MTTADRLAIDGGDPVRHVPWPTYEKGDVFVREDDELAGQRALRSRRYFRYDDRAFDDTETGRYEAKLSAYFGARYALACHSGTTAIALSLMATVEPGSLVATQGFGFAATPSAILLAGCRPLLIEVDDDLCIDVDDLRAKLTPDVAAVVPVHMRGFAADMTALLRTVSAFDIPMIEDAVPSLGLTLRGRHVGTFGRAGAFSTQSDKSLNTGEGGFVLTDDRELFARATVLSGAYEGRVQRHLDGDGATAVDDLRYPIYGFRMDEIRSAVAASALAGLPTRLRRHQSIYDRVVNGIADLPHIILRRPVAHGAYLGHALVFRVRGGADGSAAWFARALRHEGIDARNFGDPEQDNVRCFWNWRFLYPGRDLADIRATLPRTSALLDEAVDIPLSSTLTERDCGQVVRAIRKVAGAMTRV